MREFHTTLMTFGFEEIEVAKYEFSKLEAAVEEADKIIKEATARKRI